MRQPIKFQTMSKTLVKPPKKTGSIDGKIRRRTFISFAVFGSLGAVAYKGWKWLSNSPAEPGGVTGGAKEPFRQVLDKNEAALKKVFSPNNLAKTYPKSRAVKTVRKNGNLGLKGAFIEEDWRLKVEKKSGQVLEIRIDELKSLPKTEIIFDFKCVEGWDQIQHWGGVRFIDFIEHYNLSQEASMKYTGLLTPDGKYYVGMDMESAIHPQTILAYEMNDEPLIRIHGAPLRLIVPVKYGIKNLKCIGTINFSNDRPRDYWAERGYDYYAGL